MSKVAPAHGTLTKKGFFGTGLVRADRMLRTLGMPYSFSFETLELQVKASDAAPLLFPYTQLLMMSEDAFQEALTRVPDQLPTPGTETPKALKKKRSSQHLNPGEKTV